jgi:hypothetical protein
MLEILLIIMLAPLAILLGVGILRMLASPAFWFTVIPWGVAVLLMMAHHG